MNDLVVALGIVGYAIIALIVARACYTLYDRGELVYADVDPRLEIFCIALFWPLVLIALAVSWFITGGARKARRKGKL